MVTQNLMPSIKTGIFTHDLRCNWSNASLSIIPCLLDLYVPILLPQNLMPSIKTGIFTHDLRYRHRLNINYSQQINTKVHNTRHVCPEGPG